MGDAAVQRIQNATVMVVGCGAVGSFTIEALARCGVGHIILIDHDVVEESNINRQLFALQSTVGMPKVDVARARIHDINPDTRVDAHKIFFDDNFNLDVGPSFVIDAIDTTESKIALYRWCGARGIPFISSMGAARKTKISEIKIAPITKTSVCPLASKIRRIVRESHIPPFDVVYSTEVAAPVTRDAGAHVFGSIITVTGTFGLAMAGYVIDHIANAKK